MSQTPTGTVEDAVAAFRDGSPVLVHDAADREGETDLVYPASAVTPDAVARLRNDAGGLVCVALDSDVADAFDLAYMDEVLDHPASEDQQLGYDERSSFSLTVNHRDTYTGITDDDRALTITELGDAASRVAESTPSGDAAANAPASDGGAVDAVDEFSEQFRAPGHVHLLRAAPNLLDEREGHTELGIALADAADREPAVVVCEMLDDETGGALSPTDARAYADRHDLPYVEGADLIDSLH